MRIAVVRGSAWETRKAVVAAAVTDCHPGQATRAPSRGSASRDPERKWSRNHLASGSRVPRSAKHPWLIGSSVRLEIDNLLDSKPKVRDAFGDVPFSYQQDLLDPRGRTVSLSFRKLFLPQRFRNRAQRPAN